MFLDENNLSMVVGLSLFDTHFLFPGDIERQGWLALLRDNPALRDFVRKTDVLLASHHGRENGICEEMFYQLGCNPSLVVISDDYHKYDTQQTVQYYKSIAKGIPFRGRNRWVLTTRNDGDIIFRFDDHGRCDIY
jgi:beta-lactamase superfamily II metal-dependent hydrolase